MIYRLPDALIPPFKRARAQVNDIQTPTAAGTHSNHRCRVTQLASETHAMTLECVCQALARKPSVAAMAVLAKWKCTHGFCQWSYNTMTY